MSGGIYLIFTLLIASPCMLLLPVAAVNHGSASLPTDETGTNLFKLRSECCNRSLKQQEEEKIIIPLYPSFNSRSIHALE